MCLHLDTDVDLKACIACLTFIITSATRFGCDQSALHSELQQLGLPREHSTSIKRIVDENANDLAAKFKAASLKGVSVYQNLIVYALFLVTYVFAVNALQDVKASINKDTGCAIFDLTVKNETKTVTLTSFTLDVMLQDLKEVRNTMQQLSQ